jgi:hypothetical protein
VRPSPLPAVGKAEVSKVSQTGTFRRNLGILAPLLVLLSLAPAQIWRSHQAWFLGLGVPACLLVPVSAILGSPRLALLCSCLVGLQGASAQILLVARTLEADNLFVALAYIIACADAAGAGVILSTGEIARRREKLRKRRTKRHE